MSTLFISDLHLDANRPEVTRGFYQFLDSRAGQAHALYILGDFFEVWIGDDDDAALCVEVKAKLTQFSQHTPLFVMPGNRDFLYGQQFCLDTGATLLNDPTVIDLYGKTTLLMHGDSLCIDDHEYMAFRSQARNPEWQAQLLAQPLEARRQLAAQLRQQSKSMSAIKADDIMDVNQAEVQQQMRNHQAQLLIHGHTHRPQRHSIAANAERIVLGDWHQHGWCVEANEHSVELQQWQIAP